MTREEVIDKLQDLWNEVYNEDSDGYIYAEALDMAIESLSADAEQGGDAEMSPLQKPQTTPMQQSPSDGADLISRADVLALAEKGYIISNSNYKKVCDLINELPSASTQTSGDFISRADALEAVENLQTEQWIDSDIDYNNGLESAVAEIKALPSAEAVKVAYICDGRKCDADCSDCFRTLDIEHAKDFKLMGSVYYQQESADRPSGEWVIVNEGLDIYICDQCGEVEQIQRIPIWDYCPNCGAKMGSDTR